MNKNTKDRDISKYLNKSGQWDMRLSEQVRNERKVQVNKSVDTRTDLQKIFSVKSE